MPTEISIEFCDEVIWLTKMLFLEMKNKKCQTHLNVFTYIKRPRPTSIWRHIGWKSTSQNSYYSLFRTVGFCWIDGSFIWNCLARKSQKE